MGVVPHRAVLWCLHTKNLFKRAQGQRSKLGIYLQLDSDPMRPDLCQTFLGWARVSRQPISISIINASRGDSIWLRTTDDHNSQAGGGGRREDTGEPKDGGPPEENMRMQKTKTHRSTRFPGSVIQEAYSVFLSKLDQSKPVGTPTTLSIGHEDEVWEFDSVEEWLAEYGTATSYSFSHFPQTAAFHITDSFPQRTRVSVRFPSRPPIESVFQVFERNADASGISANEESESSPTVFIGHGHDQQWRDLKDHLHDQHGIEVITYEVGPRAGRSVKDVLEDMLDESSLALLVLTGEDLRADGEVHARENVIHEVGLFQGRLGFTRAIVLLEDGVSEFSNILGMNQIRFSKGRIRETYGDVIATIKREFGTRDE